MASTQEAEIIFAQKLASNEKPTRSKALLKLRKYIRVRSEKETGGFSEVELLKIWKGLFYCLWMQDMPLLQEELSTKISALLHSFRTTDSQLLYFKTFLQTMKREWNGIDRLRMDKFYQLVRLVFREMFEILKRQDWKSSLVNEFLKLISEQLLQSSSLAPSGLILHILDLYMTELAVIGSDTLTAKQNLTFIEPFCKTLAKSKDRVMLKAIGSNIFNTIVDQVPYAIEDLLREIRGSERHPPTNEAQMNDDDDQEEDSGVVEDDVSDVKGDGDCGPVLQFDYGAVADTLFQLASHTNIPSFNRSKIYKFVKIFRDLAEGVFPQDQMEDVSTDDEDEDDNRRRKKKRKRAKKQTDKADEKSSERTAESDPSQDCKQEKKKKRKKKRSKGGKDQTGADRPLAQSDTEVTENTDSSDLRPEEKEGECAAAEEMNISVPPPAPQTKKRKPKKTRQVHDVKLESDVTTAPEHASRGDEPSTLNTPQKKTRGQDEEKMEETCTLNTPQKKTRGQDEEKMEETCISSAPEEPSPSTLTTPQKKRKTRKTSTEMKLRKSERVKLDAEESQEMTHEHTNTSNNNNNKKKKKKKLRCVELNGDTTERMRRKRPMMNGHTQSQKRPKTLSCESPDINTEGFVFSEKKSPTALFCRSTRMSKRRQSVTTPKSETKKVTFGLKNNRTMEFRKMDRSSLVSPGGPSSVAFDPKKTPKSGVLKSPTSSPALRRRSTAADFF